ncbi:M16 family metallopeptidase [Biformimicrobium ophioploci]|uniref:Pitrilysin family protein n=1 Tax=Biformimicrobium ophioploci TaxID=3036711 RepID=A0ABQ6M112_9GAMM|nr:pitrilysin family protein [Microbulbifer sp. NKW57]GMG88023.1 pitrilysin family protein [Microbulbifer sp. NKW57]
MNRLSILFAALLLAGCAPEESSTPSTKTALPEGVEFVEQVASQAGKTVIPYHKYTLSNGLTLILHEDHSDPLVHVDVTYHVGSAREEVGKSGFAHFFEHMMFQGSENVADEQHFKLITEAGGTMNGTTNSDRTNYYQTVPANQLEKVLWLESDRMGYLLDAVTQEKFEVQRETVKNERGQRIDNRPYGRLYERVAAALYPDGHPYSWPVIGYMEDLNRVDVNDLKAFFLRWYGPNNATLTIGGDIDIEEALVLVERYFGAIPRGPEVAKPKKAPASLEEDRYISMEDNVHLPLIHISFPTVRIRHEDEAPLDVLSFILGSGKTSLLYKNLVKSQMAVQAQASHPCQELACTFNLLALPHPASGKSLADMETVIRATLDEFEKRGVQDDDLTKAKAQMEAGFVFGLQSVSGKVSQLASNETFTGNPNYIEEDIARYNNVTKADVMRVYRQYIKGNHAVIMSVVPNGQADMVAKKDTYTQGKRKGIDSVKLVKEEDLKLRRAEADFDRSVIPTAGANRPVDVPEMWRNEMANGIKVLGTQSTETPTTSLLLKIPAGHYYTSPQKAGMASLLAQMLSESTSKRSAEEMTKALEMLGSRVSVYADNHYINVSINTLSKHLDATMDLVAEKLFEPALLPDEFERRRSNAIQSIKNNKKNASYLASTAYRQLLHDDNIAALPGGGTEQTLAEMSVDDVKAFYEQHFLPAKAQLIVVSELDQKALEPHLTSLAKWEGKGPELAIELPVPAVEAGTIYLVNKEDAAQSAIRIGKRSLTYDVTGEFYKAYLMNFPLGGAFNSRINLNLREDKGYTYGARSFFDGDLLSGNYTASAEVRADVTDKSIVEFMEEIRNYADNGITAEELAFMRNAINQKDALRYETPRAKLGFLAKILEYDLDPNFVEKRTEIVKSISADEINSLAKKHLNPDDMIMVVVGDAETLKPQLEALGYKVVNYDV